MLVHCLPGVEQLLIPGQAGPKLDLGMGAFRDMDFNG